MKKQSSPPVSQEIELKLSLPGANPAELANILASLPRFAGCKPSRQTLHNIYFDTPEQHLRQQRVALRLRQVGGGKLAQWFQTLKTSGDEASALSRRGEWESPVAGAALSAQALQATPWLTFDPKGKLFGRLTACFETNFERTTWLLGAVDGSKVEVALDIGQIKAGQQLAPICEIELELKAGDPGALFDVAREIAARLAVLPANASKAERGFLLALGELGQARHAQEPTLHPGMSTTSLAQRVLTEMFAQFTANLDALCTRDDPELVHQARVGWRRFRSGLRFFHKSIALHAIPERHELHSLLVFLGELRNLDVALTETLPPLAPAYCEGDDRRTQAWQAMLTTLTEAAVLQRKAVRYALREPGVGLTLLSITEWLDHLGAQASGEMLKKGALRRWAKAHVARLQRRLTRSQTHAQTPLQQHRVRIHAKRLRYMVQALRPWLPAMSAQTLTQAAQVIQATLGARRDLMQASALVAMHACNPELVEFLRGVVTGASLVETNQLNLSSSK